MPHKKPVKPATTVMRTTITFYDEEDHEEIDFIMSSVSKAYTIRQLIKLGFIKFKELNQEGHYES